MGKEEKCLKSQFHCTIFRYTKVVECMWNAEELQIFVHFS